MRFEDIERVVGTVPIIAPREGKILYDFILAAGSKNILELGFAHGTSHFFQLMLPPLFPWLMSAYSLSYTHIGTLMTVFYVVSGTGQALAGFLVDRWGAHRVLCLGVALLASSGILVAAAPALWGLYLAAFVAGAGNSVFHPADYALLNHRVSQPRLGHAFSVHGLSGNVGWALAPLAMTTVATAFGWRTAGLFAAITGAASLSALWWKDYPFRSSGLPKHSRSECGFSDLAVRTLWLRGNVRATEARGQVEALIASAT